MPNIKLSDYFQTTKLNQLALAKLSPVDCLNEIYAAHVKTFPFSNLELRKIARQHPIHRSIPYSNYANLLTSQRGGFCFQSVGLLHDVLTQLSYKSDFCVCHVLVGAEINSPGIMRSPPTHVALKTSIDGRDFLLDPGMGSSAPRLPIPIPGLNESVIQGSDEFKFHQVDSVYVLEQKTSRGWFRLMQTDLVAASQQTIEKNLYKLVQHPGTLPIRDEKTVLGLITDKGRHAFFWNEQSEAPKFTKQDGITRTESILADMKLAAKVLDKEFCIKTVSTEELTQYCSPRNSFGRWPFTYRPKKAWTVELPLDEKELKKMSHNLIPSDATVLRL